MWFSKCINWIGFVGKIYSKASCFTVKNTWFPRDFPLNQATDVCRLFFGWVRHGCLQVVCLLFPVFVSLCAWFHAHVACLHYHCGHSFRFPPKGWLLISRSAQIWLQSVAIFHGRILMSSWVRVCFVLHCFQMQC